MSVFKIATLAAVTALIAACAGVPVNDFGAPNPQIHASPRDATAETSKDISAQKLPQKDAVSQDQNPPIRKVALSMSSVSDPTSNAYKIGPRDVLEVTVFKTPELSKTVQVSEVGTINFPLVGEVQASGRTAREVEHDLTQSLGAKYLQNPQISIFVKDYNSQRVTMEGAIKKPGVYPIAGGLSLLQATAVAGGFEDTADQTVLLFRQQDGRRFAGRYDVAAIRKGNAEDVQLEAGDIIIVPTSDLKEGMSVVLKLVPLATLAPLL